MSNWQWPLHLAGRIQHSSTAVEQVDFKVSWSDFYHCRCFTISLLSFPNKVFQRSGYQQKPASTPVCGGILKNYRTCAFVSLTSLSVAALPCWYLVRLISLCNSNSNSINRCRQIVKGVFFLKHPLWFELWGFLHCCTALLCNACYARVHHPGCHCSCDLPTKSPILVFWPTQIRIENGCCHGRKKTWAIAVFVAKSLLLFASAVLATGCNVIGGHFTVT